MYTHRPYTSMERAYISAERVDRYVYAQAGHEYGEG